MKIRDLKVASATVDLSLVRHDSGVTISITRRLGKAEVVVSH